MWITLLVNCFYRITEWDAAPIVARNNGPIIFRTFCLETRHKNSTVRGDSRGPTTVTATVADRNQSRSATLTTNQTPATTQYGAMIMTFI